MWSGPRNLSTAMMYAFAQRADFAVSDEPFYAAYLAKTGLDHPMRAEILAAQSSDPVEVAAMCIGPVPGGKPHWYQKHMAHHTVPGIPTDWLAEVGNVILIRHPARVVASYAKKREGPVLEDLGFVQLAALYDRIGDRGADPLVIDSAVIRAAPEAALRTLCEALGLAFDPAMLSWPAGGNPADGVWASHWYGAVHRSTGFDAAEGPLPDLAEGYAALAASAMPYYERLSAVAIRP